MIYWRDSGLSIQWYSRPRFIPKAYKANSVKGKGTWVKVQRKSGIQASRSCPLVESHRTHFILPTSCDNLCEELSVRKTHERLGTQGDSWALVIWAPSAYHVPKYQTPRHKAGVPTPYQVYAPYCLYKTFTCMSPSCHLWEVLYQYRELTKFSDAQGPIL